MSEIIIREARAQNDIEAVRAIFRDYIAMTDDDPTFGGIEDEVASLPGIYAPPRGLLLLARAGDGTVVGGGSVRPLPGPGDCGLTAVLVSPAGRGQGIGRKLLMALIEGARAAGHRRMFLDTLNRDPAVKALWQSAGFVPSQPYFPNPRPGSQHMVLDLTQIC